MPCLNEINLFHFKGYGILLHEIPVVAVLFTQSNNNEGPMIVKLEFELQNLNVDKYGINLVK